MQAKPTISLSKLALAGLALALWLGLLLPSLDRSRMQDVDELWHAVPAQKAALDHEWAPLVVDGRPFFEKPPLVIWLAALTVQASGQPFAAWPYRLWNTIGGALLLVSVLGLGWLAGSYWGGLWAACLIGLQGDFVFHCRFFSMDTPFLGLSFLGLLILAKVQGAEGKTRYLLGAGLALGLAFWCKSWFVLALVPAVSVAVWVTFPRKQLVRTVGYVGGVTLAFALAWLIFYAAILGSGFLWQEWRGNLLGRLATHGAGFWQHCKAYLFWVQTGAPAMLVLTPAVCLGLRVSRVAATRRGFVTAFAWALAWSWVLGLLIVKDVVLNYVLPMEIAVALALGLALAEAQGAKERAWLSVTLLLAALAMNRWGPPWVYVALGGILGLVVARTRALGQPLDEGFHAGFLQACAVLLLFLQVPDAVGLCTRPRDEHRDLAALLLSHPPLQAGDVLYPVDIPTRAVDFYSRYRVQHVASVHDVPAGQACLIARPNKRILLVTESGTFATRGDR